MSDKKIELTHKQAVNRLKDIADEIERLSAKAEEGDGLNTEDETYWNELRSEANDVDGHRKSLEREHDRERIMAIAGREQRGELRVAPGSDRGQLDADPIGEPDSIEDKRFGNPWDLSEIRTFNRSKEEVGGELRARALCAIEQMRGMNQARREGATKIIEEFDNERGDIAKMALATSSPEYLRAFTKAAQGQEGTQTVEEKAAYERAMSLTDSAGGYLIPFQLDPTVIITSDGSLNEIRRVARQVVATGDKWHGVSSGAVSWSFDDEATEVSDDTTTFAQPTIDIRTARGFVPISIEAMQDEQNVAQEVGRLLMFGKEDLEATKFIDGASGSDEPIGVVTALDGVAASTVDSATTDTFALEDVYALQGDLPARYRRNASWLANNLIYNLIRNFTVAGGADVWERLQADRPPLLLGKPALEAEQMDGSITALAANLVLIFGDFQNYVIADRIGTTVEFIPHLFHTTSNRPSGQRGWYAHYRVGADSVNDGAFRILDVT
jgi:HK97 family phage major capsid protein